MANSLGTRPIVIDTAGATVLRTEWLHIMQIVFTDYALDTDNFVVQDKNGNEVFSGNGANDLAPVNITNIGFVHGLKVPTLSAGKLLIFTK